MCLPVGLELNYHQVNLGMNAQVLDVMNNLIESGLST